MARLPSPRQPWLHTYLPLGISVVAALGAIIAAGIAWYKALSDGTTSTISLWVLVVFLSILAKEALSIYRVFLDMRRQRRLESAHELHAAGQVLREILAARFSDQVAQEPDDTLRATAFRVCIYRVVPSHREVRSSELERVTAYCVGEGGDPGEAGKRISTACGVVGLAYRTGVAQVAERQKESLEQFWDEMVQTWGFSQEEARSLNRTRWSYLAVPIKDEAGRVDTVVFLDSQVKDCLTDDVIESIIFPACEAIGLVIEQRYGHGH